LTNHASPRHLLCLMTNCQLMGMFVQQCDLEIAHLPTNPRLHDHRITLGGDGTIAISPSEPKTFQERHESRWLFRNHHRALLPKTAQSGSTPQPHQRQPQHELLLRRPRSERLRATCKCAAMQQHSCPTTRWRRILQMLRRQCARYVCTTSTLDIGSMGD
jgi:hypothetical protein